MNKSKTLVYEDFDNADSYLLCLEPYGLKLLLAVPLDEDRTEVTVYGAPEDVDRFADDYEHGGLDPIDQMSASLEFDEDYEGWLNNEVWWMKQWMQVENGLSAEELMA